MTQLMDRSAKLSIVLMVALAAQLLQPARAAAQADTRPAAAVRADLDPAVEKILDRLEARGKDIKDIQADLVFIKRDPIFNSVERFEGILLFKEDKPNPKFHIRFDRGIQNGRATQTKEWHVFDGRWYTEAREKNKTIVKHEVLRPNETREVFRLGRGPFPLPFGQRKEDILRHFTVKLAPPAPKDPPDSDHLELTPLPGTEMDKKYETVHFFIDRKLVLPSRVQTVEKDSGEEIVATFANSRLNQGVTDDRMKLPDLPGYGITEDRLPAEDAKATRHTQ